MHISLATKDDLPSLRAIMHAAIEHLQGDFLTPEQVAVSHAVMGLDSQLIRDRTYFKVHVAGQLAGCGGWSRRETLYGGDNSAVERQPRLLDPVREPARIRAMYTHPAFARKGVGRTLLETSEASARGEGFVKAELMATLSGEPLYRASGYEPIEHVEVIVGQVTVPLVRMSKFLAR